MTTTDDIMALHRECMHKLATPANEHALRTAVESLVAERDALAAELASAALSARPEPASPTPEACFAPSVRGPG